MLADGRGVLQPQTTAEMAKWKPQNAGKTLHQFLFLLWVLLTQHGQNHRLALAVGR